MSEPARFTLSIVIPVYNEEKFIDSVIERLKNVKFQPGVETEIIAVDDCSKDSTWEKLQAWEKKGVKIAHHEVNGGKGAALHTGFRLATGDAVTVQDSDFEYTPEDLPAVLQPILDGRADAVFGAREQFCSAGAHRVMRYWHKQVNCFLTRLCNMFSDIALSDMECCYKMFRLELLRRITLKENRFGFEPEVTIKIAAMHPRICEVPVSYSSRTYAEGKKITWKDGASAVRCILKYGLLRIN